MKYKSLLKLYGAFMAVGFNLGLSIFFLSVDFTLVMLIIYPVLFYLLDKKAFIDRTIVLLNLNVFILFHFLYQMHGYSMFIGLFMLINHLVAHKYYLPCRKKVKDLFREIEEMTTVSIHRRKIENKDTQIALEFDLRQTEIDWLAHKILLKHSNLSSIVYEYKDNEFVGDNFKVNIV